MKMTRHEAKRFIELYDLRVVEHIYSRRGERMQVVDKRGRPHTLNIRKAQ